MQMPVLAGAGSCASCWGVNFTLQSVGQSTPGRGSGQRERENKADRVQKIFQPMHVGVQITTST